MKLQIVIEGETKDVRIDESNGQVVVVIDGDSRAYDLSEPEPGTLLLKNDGNVFEANVSEIGEEVSVALRNSEFTVSVRDPKSFRGAGTDSAGGAGSSEIVSAMPGKVVEILAEVGNEVVAGEGVLVVEAMKMQNELKSPKDGRIAEIKVKADDRVDAGDILAVIE